MIPMLQLYIFLIFIITLVVTVVAQKNLAFQGTAEQQSTLTDSLGSHTANLAIEGPANNNWEDGCSSTEPNQAYVWWSLTLPRVAFITNVVIYYRGDTPHQMNDFRLYVSNSTIIGGHGETLCYTDLGIPGLPNTTQDIDCYFLAKSIFYFNRYKSVELCYVAVNGCSKGTWGINCTTDCPVDCIDSHCFPENGSCVWGCDVQRCFHGKCDAKLDVCTKGCVPGQGGRYCTFYNTVYNGTAKQSLSGVSIPANVLVDGIINSCISISSKSLNTYIQIGNGSLIVITGVYLFVGDGNSTAGDHKVYCSNATDAWANSTVLYNAEYVNEDIDVFAVCKYIVYIPPIINANVKIDICEIEIGGCFYGKYGDSCQLTCPENCKGPCDLINGNCLFGCFDGWLGNKCDKACDEDKFGGQCLRDCSANCLLSSCDHVTGTCTVGCEKGWEGYNCTEECSEGNFGWSCLETCDGCIANECSYINGVCKNTSVCKPGYVYGKYCNQTCDTWHFGTNCNKMCNCLNKPCNKFTGKCPDGGCKMGWTGDSCDQECSHGYFGSNCKQFCGGCFDHSCNKLNGSCDRCCKEGYMGPLCATSAVSMCTDSPVSTQIGLFIGGLVLGALLTLGIVVTINRRRIFITKRQKNKTVNTKSPEQHCDNFGMETASTYQDLTAHSVSNDYDQINTLYINQ